MQKLEVDQGTVFDASLSQMQMVYQFNVRTVVRAIVQYTNVDRDPALYRRQVDPSEEDVFGQFLFSYKLNPQTVLFLGYSDNQLGGELDGNPLALTRADRTLFLKVGYALVM
jgi:hypothetical protein